MWYYTNDSRPEISSMVKHKKHRSMAKHKKRRSSPTKTVTVKPVEKLLTPDVSDDWNERWIQFTEIFQQERNSVCDRNNCNNNLLYHWFQVFNQFVMSDHQRLEVLDKVGYSEIYGTKLTELSPPTFEVTPNSNVMIAKDFVPVELARECRRFLASMWILHTESTLMLGTLRDEFEANRGMYSLMDVFNLVILKTGAPGRYSWSVQEYNSGMWRWEKYNPDFYRAAPANYISFVMSPVYKLIQCIAAKWEHTKQFMNYDVSKLSLDTFVVQKIPQGHGIIPHNDEQSRRRIAFIYYLTDDGWSAEDGGEFCVSSDDGQQWDNFIPEFNSVIAMNMTDNKSPLHKVETVISDRNRVSLVGFLSSTE